MPKQYKAPSPKTGGLGNPGTPNVKPKTSKSASAGDKDKLGKSQSIPTGQTQKNRKP